MIFNAAAMAALSRTVIRPKRARHPVESSSFCDDPDAPIYERGHPVQFLGLPVREVAVGTVIESDTGDTLTVTDETSVIRDGEIFVSPSVWVALVRYNESQGRSL
jgi:hypothetical protein